MLKTTTLFKIVRSELIKAGKNEFVNYDSEGRIQLSKNNKDFIFINKMIKYDSDVSKIVDDMFFYGYKFPNATFDKWFKKTFLNRFLNKQIGFQTVELFASYTVGWCMTNETELMTIFNHYEDFITNKQKSSSADGGKNGYNNGVATLPQDEVNLDLTSNSMNYADNNTIQRGFDERKSNSDSQAFNPDNLDKMKGLYEEKFTEMYKKLFLLCG